MSTGIVLCIQNCVKSEDIKWKTMGQTWLTSIFYEEFAFSNAIWKFLHINILLLSNNLILRKHSLNLNAYVGFLSVENKLREADYI